MLRKILINTIAAAAATSVVAAGAQAADPPVGGGPQADAVVMATSIRAQLSGRAFGYQFAIAQNGKLTPPGAGGWARSAVDSSDQIQDPMQPTMRMELASATKTITAVATLKLLRANGLTIESSIDPYLPANWTRGDGFKTKEVRFRHLLAHTSGLGQAFANLKAADVPKWQNDWDGVRFMVANGTTPDSGYSYKNGNYAMLRVLNAELWKRINGGAVNESTQAQYALAAMQKLVFTPAGIANVTCVAANPSTAAMSYPAGANLVTAGFLHQLSSAEDAQSCAGHRGIQLSAVDHVRFLAYLRAGKILHPDDLALMDELELGWSPNSNGSVANSTGAFWHGGDLIGTFQQHTCGMTFPDGTQASLIINSPQTTGTTQCGVLLNAWNVAR